MAVRGKFGTGAHMKTARTNHETNELPPPATDWIRHAVLLLVCLGLFLVLAVAAPDKTYTNVKAKQGTDATSQYIEEL